MKLRNMPHPANLEQQVDESSEDLGREGRRMGRRAGGGGRSLVEDLLYRESPSTQSATRHVAIVMDALREFSREPLEWALAHVMKPGYVVTLLGVMPWLNLPLSVKTWLDIWMLNYDELKELKEWEWKPDFKYQKLRGIIDLCQKHGVVLQIKVVMGYPMRLLVLEQVTSLQATWVVFDRHHRKNRAFYAKKMPYNIVMMNNEGEADIVKVRPMISEADAGTPADSPAMLPLRPKVDISDKLQKIMEMERSVGSQFFSFR